MSQKKELDLISSTPPAIFERNEHGLLKGIPHIFNEDGYVDWFKMLKPEHLAPDKKKTPEKDVTKIPEEELILLLPGLKYLSVLRGHYSVDYSPIFANDVKVCVKCTICWIPNYETEGRQIIFSSLADASIENTEGFGQIYLTTIAENRAFVRCVRNFLRIKNVSREELKDNSEETEIPSVAVGPAGTLQNLLNKTNISFGSFIARLVADGRKEASAWSSINDIPKPVILEMIGRLNKKLKESQEKLKEPQIEG